MLRGVAKRAGIEEYESKEINLAFILSLKKYQKESQSIWWGSTPDCPKSDRITFIITTEDEVGM